MTSVCSGWATVRHTIGRLWYLTSPRVLTRPCSSDSAPDLEARGRRRQPCVHDLRIRRPWCYSMILLMHTYTFFATSILHILSPIPISRVYLTSVPSLPCPYILLHIGSVIAFVCPCVTHPSPLSSTFCVPSVVSSHHTHDTPASLLVSLALASGFSSPMTRVSYLHTHTYIDPRITHYLCREDCCL